MKKIILDTNILVASAYAPESASRRLVEACLRKELQAVLSPALKKEYEHILPRAVHTKAFEQELKEFLEQTEMMDAPSLTGVVPDDPDDDKLIAVAVAAGADAIITNDDHLLRLDPYEGIRIVPPGEFVKTWDRIP